MSTKYRGRKWNGRWLSLSQLINSRYKVYSHRSNLNHCGPYLAYNQTKRWSMGDTDKNRMQLLTNSKVYIANLWSSRVVFNGISVSLFITKNQVCITLIPCLLMLVRSWSCSESEVMAALSRSCCYKQSAGITNISIEINNMTDIYLVSKADL